MLRIGEIPLIHFFPGQWIAMAAHALNGRYFTPRSTGNWHRRQYGKFSERLAEDVIRYRVTERPVALDRITMLAAVRQVTTTGCPAEPVLDRVRQLRLASSEQEFTGIAESVLVFEPQPVAALPGPFEVDGDNAYYRLAASPAFAVQAPH